MLNYLDGLKDAIEIIENNPCDADGYHACSQQEAYKNLIKQQMDSFSYLANPVENRVRQGVSQPVLRAETSNVIGLLENCKYKLRLYRADHSGEYIGGMEYTELIQQINDMQEKLSKQSA